MQVVAYSLQTVGGVKVSAGASSMCLEVPSRDEDIPASDRVLVITFTLGELDARTPSSLTDSG